MLVKDIKNKELRELAISRLDEGRSRYTELIACFVWKDTPEGSSFWSKVNEGSITRIETRQTILELEQEIIDIMNNQFELDELKAKAIIKLFK